MSVDPRKLIEILKKNMTIILERIGELEAALPDRDRAIRVGPDALHGCVAPAGAKSKVFGPAVEWCQEDDEGVLWVGNGEYETCVNYCPFCGYRSRLA